MRVIFCCIFSLSICFNSTLWAQDGKRLSPIDVYSVILLVEKEVEAIRQEAGVSEPWPMHRESEGIFYPRHVLQRSLELYAKLNIYRSHKKMGPIAYLSFPARPITPQEVYDSVSRLYGELRIVRGVKMDLIEALRYKSVAGSTITATSNYHLLHRCSRAMDAVLGIRGYTPSHVYHQSLRILANAKFLRRSQGFKMDVPQPVLEMEHHPNHSLEVAYDLLRTIASCEAHLWMKPCHIPQQQRRTIQPNEVYDALQVVLAEQQRIKYRLGLDRYFEIGSVAEEKSDDDIIQCLRWAQAYMPTFSMKVPLFVQNQKSLIATPSDVYNVACRIQAQLERLREVRGIRTSPRAVERTALREPKHVYQKLLGNLNKIARLRELEGIGQTAVLPAPLRVITPVEVFDLVTRIEREVDILGGIIDEEWNKQLFKQLPKYEKTPSDVYEVMSINASLLDTLLGSSGYAPSDVWGQACLVVKELRLIQEYLGVPGNVERCLLETGKEPSDTLALSEKLSALFRNVQQRAGMTSGFVSNGPPLDAEITPNDVYNEIGILLSEIDSFKIHMTLYSRPRYTVTPTKMVKTPSHVWQELMTAELLIQLLLNTDARLQEGN